MLCAPNPFNRQTLVSYTLPESAHVHLSIFDSVGQRVRELVHSQQPAGVHSMSWDATDGEARAVGSGTYYCELKFDGERHTFGLTLAR